MADRALGRFLWLYPLANAGAYIAFLPLLSVVVPLRAEALAGPAKIALLSATLIAGVIAATAANIAGGMLSDWSRRRHGTRLPWIAAGLAGCWGGYALIGAARTPGALVGGVVAFQIVFNLLFASLTALLPDEVPDRLKARVAAVTTLALPIGSLAAALVGMPVLRDDAARLVAIGTATTLLILPLLLLFRPHGRRDDAAPFTDDAMAASVPGGWRAFRNLWIAKFLVQVSGTVMVSYFLFYLKDEVAGASAGAAQLGFGRIVGVATLVSAFASIAAGRWSDRHGRRRSFLMAAVGLMMAGLLVLAARHDWAAAAIGYVFFAAGLGVFLTIDVALVAQILPSAERRGRHLGLMNAANTLPAIIGPLLMLGAVAQPHGGYGAVFLALTAALAVSLLVLAASRRLA